MSEFAFFRFMSNNMLTTEESQHKDEIINLTEVLHAKGLERDDRISNLSEEKLREILEENYEENWISAFRNIVTSYSQLE